MSAEMADPPLDSNRTLMVDGNAVAGLLYELFGTEVTSGETECASCGKQGEVGSLLAFTHAPGVILRCPACENVLFRIVQTSSSFYLDARGVVYLRLSRRPSSGAQLSESQN